MNKHLTLSFILSIITSLTFSQPINTNAVKRVPSMFQKVIDDNPYVVIQINNSGTWINNVKYYWEKSLIGNHKQHTGTYRWSTNHWIDEDYETHDLELDNNTNILGSYTRVKRDNMLYSYQYVYEYNINNNITSVVTKMSLNSEPGVYRTFSNFTISYTNNLRTKDSTYRPPFNTSEVVYYTYNNNNQITAAYKINPINTDTLERRFYDYEGDNLKTLYEEEWNIDKRAWILKWADTMVYNNGHLVSLTSCSTQTSSGNTPVLHVQKETYTYSSEGVLQHIYYSEFSDEALIQKVKFDFLYKEDGSPFQLNGYFFANNAYSNIVNVRYVFDYVTNTNYIEHITPNYRIHPNPARGIITINSDENATSHYTITDISGKVLLKNELDINSKQINISELHNGTYFITITTNNKTQTQKIIIAH
jgi:hypothetical protein